MAGKWPFGAFLQNKSTKTRATKNKTTKKTKNRPPKSFVVAFWQTTPMFGKCLLFKLHSFMSAKLCFAENTIK